MGALVSMRPNKRFSVITDLTNILFGTVPEDTEINIMESRVVSKSPTLQGFPDIIYSIYDFLLRHS